MDKQDTLFTSEQMKGSGQLDMVALIDNNKDRVRQLRRTPHKFYHDPGHGWLLVSYQDLIVLDIVGSISGCSYRKDDRVYLEEDMDATAYINALFTPYPERSVEDHSAFKMWGDILVDLHGHNESFIRNLNHFK